MKMQEIYLPMTEDDLNYILGEVGYFTMSAKNQRLMLKLIIFCGENIKRLKIAIGRGNPKRAKRVY